MNKPIYLDYNATTPVDPVVLDAMLPFLKDAFGNAASMSHPYGWEASQAVEKARAHMAQLINGKAKSIIWTSGATESNNMALLGPVRQLLRAGEPVHIITSQVEHKAVLDVAHVLEEDGAEVTYLKPDTAGMITADSVKSALRPHTKLVSIILAQNEIGTINPIGEIGALCRARDILLHTDAAQALGKTPIDVAAMNIDLLSASGHKMYAPKGIGALYVREGVDCPPLMYGGSQENGRRPGTVNVPGVVAMGKACEIAQQTMTEEVARLTQLRDDFIQKIRAALPLVTLNGHLTQRLYSNISLSFPGLCSDVFALGLSGLALSSGSACSGGAPSHILAAIGLPEDLSRSTIRLGIGRFTSEKDLAVAFDKIVAMAQKNMVLSQS